MKRTLFLLLPAAALTVGVLAGCGAAAGGAPATTSGSAGATTAPMNPMSGMPAATTAGAAITIRNYGFMVPADVSPGERVTVHNDDAVAHTVTADAGSVFGVTVPASGTATLTAPAKAGSYPFHCTYHAEMHATLVVR
jgi:plastocyanin